MKIPEELSPFSLVPKTGSIHLTNILKKLFKKKPLARNIATNGYPIYIHRVITMFIKCFDFIPYFWSEKNGEKKSEDYKVFNLKNPEMADLTNSIINSSTFFLYFISLGDCFHCGKAFINNFPCSLDEINLETKNELVGLAKILMNDIKANSVRRKANSARTGKVEYDEFWVRHSKNILDNIDNFLSAHYGLSDEESGTTPVGRGMRKAP